VATEQKMTEVEEEADLGDESATPVVGEGIEPAPAEAPENDGAAGAKPAQTPARSPYAQGL
jgi:hypothetical protein